MIGLNTAYDDKREKFVNKYLVGGYIDYVANNTIQNVGAQHYVPGALKTVNNVLSYLPITGTVMDIGEFVKEPTWSNFGWAAASLGSDIFGASLLKGTKAATKEFKAAKQAEKAAEEALNTHRSTTRNIIARSVREEDAKLAKLLNDARWNSALKTPFWDKAIEYPIYGAWLAEDAGMNTWQQNSKAHKLNEYKTGGLIKKLQFGGNPMAFSTYVSPEAFNEGTKQIASKFNTLMGKLGEAAIKLATSGASTDYGQTSPFAFSSGEERREIARGRENAKQKASEFIADKSVYISPSSHVAAWTQGSFNPKVGAEFLASDPRLQALGITGDILSFKYAPKAVKPVVNTTTKVTSNIANSIVDAAARAGNKTAKTIATARELNKAVRDNNPTVSRTISTELYEPNKKSEVGNRTSLAFYEGKPSKTSLAEKVGVPKGERAVWDPLVMLNARKFAEKYGYETPQTIELAKNMYRLHNRFFRSVNTEKYEPNTGHSFYKYAPNYKPGMSEEEVIYGLYPEFRGMSPEELRFTLASKGYPAYDRTYLLSDIGKGPLDDFVFVSPSLSENEGYASGSGNNLFLNTVLLQRPFSFGKPALWHVNADWRPSGRVYRRAHNKGEVSEGNSYFNHEAKVSTKHLIPVKIAEKGDLGTLLGDYLEKIRNREGEKYGRRL